MLTRSLVRRALVGVGAIAMLGGAGSAQGQDALKYKWNKGDVVHYRSLQDNAGKMTTMVGEQKTSQQQDVVHRFEVTDVAADGTATLDMSLLSVKITMVQGETPPSTYDSTKPADKQYEGSPRLRPMIEPMGAMIGEHLTVVIDTAGNVRKVEGMSKVLEKMVGKMGTPNPNATRNLRATFNDEAMRGNLERYFKVLPEQAVKAGDEWSSMYEQPIPGFGGRMKSSSAWKLESVDGGVAKMSSTVKVEGVPPKEGEEQAPAKTTITDGKGDGRVEFDNKAGQLVKSTLNLVLPLEISMSGPNGQGMSIKNESTIKSTYERIPAPATTEGAKAPASAS